MSESTPDTDFGARLRQAREARGISLSQIAASTKISAVALGALERNEFAKLPGGIFSRGFVRSYAQEVGLDPDETVRVFRAMFNEDSPLAAAPPALKPKKDTEESTFESRQRMASTALKLALVSLPIGALLLYLSTRGGPVAPAQGPAEPPPIVRTRPSAPVPESLRTPVEAAPATGADTSALAAQSPGAAAAPEDGSLRLELAPTGACWVSLTVDGALVIERVMQRGERLSRLVTREAVVQVGDAGAFAFNLNGRPAQALGGGGQVRTVRITPDNFQSLLRR